MSKKAEKKVRIKSEDTFNDRESVDQRSSPKNIQIKEVRGNLLQDIFNDHLMSIY